MTDLFIVKIMIFLSLWSPEALRLDCLHYEQAFVGRPGMQILPENI